MIYRETETEKERQREEGGRGREVGFLFYGKKGTGTYRLTIFEVGNLRP